MITEVVVRQQPWAGIDAGKSDHHCVVIDTDGNRLLSQRVANDETLLLELITAVTALADGAEVTWAIDLNHGDAALVITTTARDPKAKPTPKPSSPWPADASTSCGPCSATTPPTTPQPLPRRLDVIEILLLNYRLAGAAAARWVDLRWGTPM
jgi:Transposase